MKPDIEKLIIPVAIIGILASCSGSREPSDTIFDLHYEITIVDSINLEPQGTNVLQYGATELDSQIIFHYHNGLDHIYFFNQNGESINTIELPNIADPHGVNMISDYYYLNKDTTFVYDSEFNRILIVNDESSIIGFWDFMGETYYIGRSAAGKIISVGHEQSHYFVDVNSNLEDHFPSSKEYTESNQMVFRINLKDLSISSGINYPSGSPYRKYLFWNARDPDVEKFESQYLAIYPLDPDLYIYDTAFNLVQVVKSSPTHFPEAIGNKFGSYQTQDWVSINVKLNALGLRTKGIFFFNEEIVFARVYRAPLGDDPSIPNDLSTFISQNYQYDYYLQLFKRENGLWKQMTLDILLPPGKMSNLIHIDKQGFLYFVGKDDSREREFIYKCSLGSN